MFLSFEQIKEPMNFLDARQSVLIYLLSVMDIIPSLAHPGAGECFYQEPMGLSRTHEWSLGGRGPFKMTECPGNSTG